MTPEENKQLIRQLIEEVYVGDVCRLDDFIADDYVDHAKWKTREGLRKTLSAIHKAYPERKSLIEVMFAADDKVAVHLRFIMTGSGKKQETITETLIFRIDKGKVVEHWGNSDSFF
jgi:predicted SnoaL-like aldol condensation-catalyzing enzyme